jgi:hypothetical protein
MVCDCNVSTVYVQPGITFPCAAKAMVPQRRQDLAVQALARTETICGLAAQHAVSRKFVYQQAAKAEEALQEVFSPQEPGNDQILFHLPVTKAWLRQMVLALTLICHSSIRGVVEVFRDVFDYPIATGTVHAILVDAVEQARAYNCGQDLGGVRIGAHDEIFQNGQPVLVGADVDSTYCYLLSLEDQRDGDTWGIRLLELQDRNFHPQATVADAGSGLRAGQVLAMSGTPCRGDVFHAQRTVQSLVTFLENRAYAAIGTHGDLERKTARIRRRGGRTQALARKRNAAARAETEAIALAADVALLADWLRYDVLALAGPDHAMRCKMFDFIVAELRSREALCSHRIGPIVRALANQRDDLLAFAAQLDQDLACLAAEFQLPITTLRDVFNTQTLDLEDPTRWPREIALRHRLGGRFFSLSEELAELAQQTVRASSIIENLNSRLRNYFFLRRHLGVDYLALLQFFLNHRRFLRSERPERIGKSPAELLTGEAHPHWLEMLGYVRFSRN